MSKRQPKTCYWQDAPVPREQLVLFAETLEQRIPEDHPVRILDEILSRLDWKPWEAEYHGKCGQPPIDPSVMCRVLFVYDKEADCLYCPAGFCVVSQAPLQLVHEQTLLLHNC